MEKPRMINRWLIRVSFNSLSASPNPCGGTTALKEGVRGNERQDRLETGRGGLAPLPFSPVLFASLTGRWVEGLGRDQ